jgi:hydroxymethylpyrimidine pyrophosphatase-like HAD family hydrolase
VYSHRVSLPEERIVVEYLNDRIQSYMTRRTYDFFSKSNEVFLVPTTTRTYEQYARLSETFARFGCRYALVCNGGMLLDNNEIDLEWLAETKKIAGNELSVLNEASELFVRFYSKENIHFASNIMLYAKTDSPALDATKLTSMLNTKSLNVYYDSRKVYCVPASINKGNAVKRFSNRMGITRTIAAGDSIPDISMLKISDLAILPFSLSKSVEHMQKRIADNSHCFSDYICDVLSEIVSSCHNN